MIHQLRLLADRGSIHLGIVLDLLNDGAKYEPTESEELIEYHCKVIELVPRIWRSKNRADWFGDERGALISKQRENLLQRFELLSMQTVIKRDFIIAAKINQTLRDGETGVLILGANHRTSRFLDNDIVFRPLREDLLEFIGGDSGKNEVQTEIEGQVLSAETKG